MKEVLYWGPVCNSLGYGTAPTVGATFNYKPVSNFGFGATGLYGMINSQPSSGYTVRQSESHFLANFNYYFTDTGPGFWVGARVGLAQYSWSQSGSGYYGRYNSGTPPYSQTAFEFGPAVGCDFSLNRLMSLGFDASLLMANFAGQPSTQFDLNFLAVLKFHFSLDRRADIRRPSS